MRIGRRTAYVLCLLAFFAYEGYALFVQEAGTTSHLPPARELTLTREVNATTPLQQTFVMHAEGLQGVELFPRRSDQPPVGPLEVVVSMLEGNTGDKYVPVGRVRLDPSALDLRSSTRIVVPRIDFSGGLQLKVDISMPDAPPGHGLRFEAGGPTYVQGSMTIGGRPEWGDLKFRTLAQRTTVFRNVQRLRTSLPPLFRSDAFWLTMLVVVNWAIATLVYSLAFAPDERDAASAASQLPKGSVAGIADQPRV